MKSKLPSRIAIAVVWIFGLSFLGAGNDALAQRPIAPDKSVAAGKGYALQALAPSLSGLGSIPSVGTAFSYQGFLKKDGSPVTGECDMQFKLWDAPTGGIAWATCTSPSVQVVNGLFTVFLNFGAWFNGSAFYLETLASFPASPSPSYVSLGRQPIAAVPYALGLRPGAMISGDAPWGLFVSTSANNGNAIYAQSSGTGLAWGVFAMGTQIGVRGVCSAADGYGVYGYNNQGVGVVGHGGDYGTGVVALGNNAYGSTPTIALEIQGGGLKVSGANRPAFVHTVHTSGPYLNVPTSFQPYATVIDNMLVNSQPDAILIVTPCWGPASAGVGPAPSPVAVYYDDIDQCGFGAGRWVIYNYVVPYGESDPRSMNDGQLFNVWAVRQ